MNSCEVFLYVLHLEVDDGVHSPADDDTVLLHDGVT